MQSCHQLICNKLRQQVNRSRLDAARLDCAIRGYATDFDAPPPVEKPLPALPPSWPGRSPRPSVQRLSGKDSNRTNARLPSPSTAVESEAEIPAMSWQLGSLILLTFGLTFIAIITIHILLPHLQRTFQLFSSLFLAGTIIFGGMSFPSPLSPLPSSQDRCTLPSPSRPSSPHHPLPTSPPPFPHPTNPSPPPQKRRPRSNPPPNHLHRHPRVGHPPRFPPRRRHNPSLPRPQLQPRRLPRRPLRPHPPPPRRHPRIPRHVFTGLSNRGGLHGPLALDFHQTLVFSGAEGG